METREKLEAKFGPNPADWPAPYRGTLTMGDAGRLHAALMVEGDETALAQAVLTRLATQHTRVALPQRWVWATYAGLWAAMAIVGYQVMGGMMGDPVLSLALGELPGWEVVQ